MLRRGNTGPAVAEWQRFRGLTADGVFGEKTHEATRAFQLGTALLPDGIVGPATLERARCVLRSKGEPMKAWPFILGGFTLAALAALAREARGGTVSEASERQLAQLHPCVAERAREFLLAADAAGIPLEVTSGYRSSAEQGRLYEKGRTTPGPKVTNAPAGRSWHNHRLAFDVAPVDENGRPHWPNDIPLWNRIGAMGKAADLEWGGDWESFVDRPHFQHTGGLSLNDAIAGGLPDDCS